MAETPLINADRPLVLFPVRLETRFFGQELRVRVFPDKIHVDTHEPELTADELEWGKHFHTVLWSAATEEARKVAWRQLADRYGAQRASWVARQLTPTNPADRPNEAAELSASPRHGRRRRRTKRGRGRPAPACCPINGSQPLLFLAPLP